MRSSFKRRAAYTSVLIGTAVVLVSCSDGTIAQCNQLIEIANQAASNVESVTQSANPNEPEAFRRIAETADQAAAQLEELELSDETLQNYKERFINLYVDTSAATQALVNAVEEQNGPAAEDAYNDLEEATNKEGPLVEEVNTYCGGTPE